MVRNGHRILSFFLLLHLSLWAFPAREYPPSFISSLYLKYYANNDSTLVVRLSDSAFYYYDHLYDFAKADSFSRLAVHIAEKSNSTALMIYACNRYLETNDLVTYDNTALNYSNHALLLSMMGGDKPAEWKTCHNRVELFISEFKYAEAFKSAQRCFYLARNMGREDLIIKSYLDLGRACNGMNRKVEAFEYFLRAKEESDSIRDVPLLRQTYSILSEFFLHLKLFDRALGIKAIEDSLIRGTQPLDSLALMWYNYELQVLYNNMDPTMVSEAQLQMIIRYAIRTNHVRMKHYVFAIYRTNLVTLRAIDRLYRLYNHDYPDEFARMKGSDTELYYRMLAFFKEYEGKMDSADYFLQKAEQILRYSQGAHDVYKANFYNRYGEFLVRNGRFRDAIGMFKSSFDLAEKSSYVPYMLIASGNLDTIYARLGDYKNAFYYSQWYKRLSDSLHRSERKEQLVLLDLNNEIHKREQKSELQRLLAEKKIRQQKTGKNLMAIAVGFLFLLTGIVFMYYKSQRRSNRLLNAAKKKSDELLLNILPHETADELKSKGFAEARRYESVTVMFTDFKDFTKASEKLSAEELVQEIHFYFSEFDRIISRHTIEKIKIIGDSYMCAGGLPLENTTHPCDVVEAALELQEFIASQRIVRQMRGKHYFELRIGIHTGPVVAGIVGIHKFAYDIWGDTVNTASRMEGEGATDKVNISETTFEQIRHRYHCTYRGKISAKHKGLVDMYFVDSRKEQS